VLNAAILCLAIGAGFGLAIVLLTRSAFVLAIGIVGIVGAWSYTAPPLKLAYRTFGELAIAFLFGILPVWTSYYIQTGSLDLVPLIPALIAAILIFEVILANEFPDALTDSAAGKRTIVVYFGARWAAAVHTTAMAAVYVLAAASLLNQANLFFAWAMLLATFPLGLRSVLVLYKETLKGMPGFRFNIMTIVLYHLALVMFSIGTLAARCPGMHICYGR
jgi:1,4-dihydroxy-2-naphthoate octaprenyltransferase